MKINRRILLILFIAIAVLFCISGKVQATYSATDKTVDSGDSVSITIESTEKLENFDIECIDAGGLSYSSCATSVQGAIANPTTKKITYAAIGGEATTLGTYTFKAPKVTEKTKYTVKFDVNGETVTSTVTVKAIETKPEPEPETPTTPENLSTPTTPETPTEQPKEKSSNAYLSTLGVRIKADLAEELGVKTNEYDFTGFSKKKTTYNVTIPSNVDYLKVEYKAADSNATVKVTGNSDFEVGSNNKITIKVTAEDGKTTEKYTIKVTQLAAEEEKPGNVIEDEEGLYLTSLSLDGIDISPEFAKDTYAYTATLSDSNITTINVNATANKNDANIEISGNTDLIVGENTINIVVKQEDSVAQTVYQITLTKEVEIILTTQDTDTQDNNLIGDIMGSINKYVIIAVAVVILMVLAVIILIILLRKENKKLKEETDYEENTEYDVYQNDETEFENNEVEDEKIEEETNETKTKNERRRTRREKGRHSK